MSPAKPPALSIAARQRRFAADPRTLNRRLAGLLLASLLLAPGGTAHAGQMFRMQCMIEARVLEIAGLEVGDTIGFDWQVTEAEVPVLTGSNGGADFARYPGGVLRLFFTKNNTDYSDTGSDPLTEILNGTFDRIFADALGTGAIKDQNHEVVGFGFRWEDSSGNAHQDTSVPGNIDPDDYDIKTCIVHLSRISDNQPGIYEGVITSVQVEDNPGGDQDGDGIPDNEDNCLEIKNDQTDNDRDGTGEACDLENNGILSVFNVNPNTPEGLQVFIEILEMANQAEPGARFWVNLPPGHIEFSGPYLGTDNALPNVSGRVRLVGHPSGTTVLLRNPEADPIRLVTVAQGGELDLVNLGVDDFDVDGDGGAVLVEQDGTLLVDNVTFSGNNADGNGGGIYSEGGDLTVTDTTFEFNTAGDCGGALSSLMDLDELAANIWISLFFSANEAPEGNSVCITASDEAPPPGSVSLEGNYITGGSSSESEMVVSPGTQLNNNTVKTGADTAIPPPEDTQQDEPPATTIMDEIEQTLVPAISLQQDGSKPPSTRPEDVCAPGANLVSLGYNWTSDASCGFDQPTDLVGVDRKLSAPDERGIRTPLPGSPLIDHGPAGLIEREGRLWPDLPCGWKDIRGLGRPQDGDGDGGFECDVGAVEAQGAGAIVAGHSGTFIDPERDGEGQFVEILNDELAVIFTFTYRPDGSGPAWFFGTASINGNSLVAGNLLRPVGTSWGNGFDPDDVWLQSWGGMSMVFPDCEASGSPGNVALSGSPALGFRPLITKAQRLTHIAGCGAQAPGPNAGLSGSFGDPARNGEGAVVEWLPDGRVAAVLFTYDMNDNQMWIVGSGMPNGKSVTLNAFYPTGFPAWNEDPDPGEVNVEPWGTFTLDYSDCNNFTFSYDSTVAGYGSGQANYTRITNLKGLSCPDF